MPALQGPCPPRQRRDASVALLHTARAAANATRIVRMRRLRSVVGAGGWKNTPLPHEASPRSHQTVLDSVCQRHRRRCCFFLLQVNDVYRVHPSLPSELKAALGASYFHHLYSCSLFSDVVLACTKCAYDWVWYLLSLRVMLAWLTFTRRVYYWFCSWRVSRIGQKEGYCAYVRAMYSLTK
jgi:hypothetical protein